MLAGRELSEAQLRDRLARRGHDERAVEAALGRLRAEHAVDDRRAADAIARGESAAGRRSRSGAQRRIERAGIASATARRAAEEAYAGVDAAALLEAAIARRLRGRTRLADERELQRLYRYLVAHGFDPDEVIRALDRVR
jgi:regulatory protein